MKCEISLLPSQKSEWQPNAKWLPQGPPFKKKRVRGTKAEGLAYERKVVKALKDLSPSAVWHGPWFSYEDRSGKRRYCQPDALCAGPSGDIYLIECKRTCLLEAYEKLEGLYRPVVQSAFRSKRTIRCIQIFKFLTKATLLAEPVLPLSELFNEKNPVVHGVHLIL